MTGVRRSTIRLRAFVVASVLMGVGAAVAVEPRLDVAVEPARFGIEDTARLVIRVIEPRGDVSQPELGELENLQVVGGPTRGSEFSFVNGVATSSVSFTYFVQGLAEGAASVGPVSVQVGSETMRADVASVEVVPGSIRPAPGSRRRSPFSQDPFEDLIPRRRQPQPSVVLRHLVEGRRLVVGQPISAAVVLDTTAGVTDFRWEDDPKYPGWWAKRVDPPDQIEPKPVEVDGTRFNRYTIARYTLVPLKPGPLVVPAVRARIGVRSRSVFDSGIFVDRGSEEIEVEVIDRPPPPDGYAGAVGDLKYTVDLEPTEIESGASAVLSIRLAGTGNLPLVEEPPSWPQCDGCETYPPEDESKITVDDAGIHGSRTWRVTLVPRRSGDLTLNPVTIAVFDPRTSSYRSHTLGPLSLTVAPPPATPTPIVAAGAVDEDLETEEHGRSKIGGGSFEWWWIFGALFLGLVVGGLTVWMMGRSRSTVIPPPTNGQSPPERARELQVALERWWLDMRARSPKPGVETEMENLRQGLETVRFAPGRADHTETIVDLEQRFRELLRRA